MSVNIEKIDEQHKSLIALLNDLGAAMRAGKGTESVGLVLNKLIDYAGIHFSMEEQLFEQYSYPGAASHRMEHNNFVKKVGKFKADFDKGTAMLSVHVMDFLSDWLKNHILKVDKAYSQFFTGKGVR